MLVHWMHSVGQDSRELISLLNENQLGKQITVHLEDFPDISEYQIALVGIGPFARAVRQELYQMNWSFRSLKMVDLGNIANPTPEVVRPVLDELHRADILPIIIGGCSKTLQQQVFAHGIKNKIHPLFVDEKIAFGQILQRSYLNGIVENDKMQFRGMTIMAYQRHLSDPSSITRHTAINVNALRLGQLKSNHIAMEPYIRDCSSLSFSLNAMKKAEAPIKRGSNPSGLKSEEACQISRYAGLNEHMSSFMIYDFDSDAVACSQTATLIGQMIWYFLDGFSNRMQDCPSNQQHLTEYIVSSSVIDHPLKFFKSQISGRWWMANPSDPDNFNALLPCTYEEYLAACRDEIPARIINMLG